jgi:hypothetical protein
MASNPLAKLKGRLSAAIDWRVRQAFETERDLMMGINEAVTELNIAYADKLAAVEKLVEDLDRRVTEMSKEFR